MTIRLHEIGTKLETGKGRGAFSEVLEYKREPYGSHYRHMYLLRFKCCGAEYWVDHKDINNRKKNDRTLCKACATKRGNDLHQKRKAAEAKKKREIAEGAGEFQKLNAYWISHNWGVSVTPYYPWR